MSTVPTVQESNQALAQQINEETLRNPDSPYANKFVGIANGQVVVVADTLARAAGEARPRHVELPVLVPDQARRGAAQPRVGEARQMAAGRHPGSPLRRRSGQVRT